MDGVLENQISLLDDVKAEEPKKNTSKKKLNLKERIEEKDKEIKELKDKISELENQGEKTAEIQFLNVDKHSRCSNESFKLSYRQLETIVEMCMDYAEILDIKSKDIEDNPYKLATYKFKAKQIREIGNKVASEIKYNKSCSSKKIRDDDIGGDAMELMVKYAKER